MKSKEFEDYLISIGGLINGWKDDNEPIISRYYFCIPDEWLEVTKNLIADLILLGWDKMITDCKEKNDSGEFYVTNSSDEIRKRIRQWQKETENL